VFGCCDRRALCVIHRDEAFAQMKGVVACRGEVWAVYVAQRAPRMLGKPWPMTARMRSIARRKVADLADDERLLELLAVELVRWAAKRWDSHR
jgi:hypothetical protein